MRWWWIVRHAAHCAQTAHLRSITTPRRCLQRQEREGGRGLGRGGMAQSNPTPVTRCSGGQLEGMAVVKLVTCLILQWLGWPKQRKPSNSQQLRTPPPKLRTPRTTISQLGSMPSTIQPRPCNYNASHALALKHTAKALTATHPSISCHGQHETPPWHPAPAECWCRPTRHPWPAAQPLAQRQVEPGVG